MGGCLAGSVSKAGDACLERISLNEKEVVSIVLSGVGGQGTVLATNILGQALVNGGFDVKTSEVHGMAQRGGSVMSAVRFGARVKSPLVPAGSASFIIATEMLEGLRAAPYILPEGIFIVSTSRIDPLSVLQGKASYPQDAIETIKRIAPGSIILDADAVAEKAGNRRAANSVLLGVVSNFLPLGEETWFEVMESLMPQGVLEVNKNAFLAGRGFQSGEGA